MNPGSDLNAVIQICHAPGFFLAGGSDVRWQDLFAQVMDVLPWKTFHCIVVRYGGNYRTRTLSCAEQFRIMAFTQLTCRENLRDIGVCLAARQAKLYHMGIREPVARATLAKAVKPLASNRPPRSRNN